MELRVAAIQLESKIGAISENLIQAEKSIKEVALKGAKLVLFPELFTTGYIPNKEIWDYCIKDKNKTIVWVKDIAKKYNVFIGMGLIEYIEGDFRNTYIITNPNGEVEGRAEKENAEAYIFRRGNGIHVIKSALGNIGVAICADNHYSDVIAKIAQEDISILLMPHALPSPFKIVNGINEEDIRKAEKDIEDLPNLVAKILGVNVVFINQIGNIGELSGLLGKMIKPSTFKLQGASKLVDNNGKTIVKMQNESGYIIGNINLIRKDGSGVIPNYNGWVQEGSVLLRKVIIPLDIMFGKIKYKKEVMKVKGD